MDKDKYLEKFAEVFIELNNTLAKLQNEVTDKQLRSKEFNSIPPYFLSQLIEEMVGKEAKLYFLIDLVHVEARSLAKDNLLKEHQVDRLERLRKSNKESMESE